MNKKLIAMAVAAGAMTAPLAAHAGATVYGNLQIEIASVDNKGYGENNTKNSRTGIATDESGIKMADNKRGRLGFKGNEDLGGGLKAIYKFEWQVDNAYGNIADGARESWVGLKGGWGEFKAGRIKSPYKYTGGVKYDPFVTTYMEARKSGGMIGGSWGQNSFWDTSVSYKNKWGGFGLWLMAGVDEGDGTSNYMRDITKTGLKDAPGYLGDYAAAVKYGTKKWEVFGVYENNGVAAYNGTDKKSMSVWKAGAMFKVGGAHKFTGQYESANNATVNMITFDGTDMTAYFLGYQFKMGKNVIALQYGNEDLSDVYSTTYYTLGWIYKFSKKTRTFVGYRNSDRSYDAAGVDNDKLSVFSLGLRVDF